MTAITIFGGTGDLTFRKLLPALYNMCVGDKLPDGFCIVAVGRRDYTTESYTALAEDWVRRFSRLPFEKELFARFAGLLRYYQMDFTDPGNFPKLDAWYASSGIADHLFYLAVAPRFFHGIVRGLSAVSSAREGKVILEKPFGESLESARLLNEELESFFLPGHVYRIDHYLGKEMVRGIHTIRFTNPIFHDAWDSAHIESVRICALEDVGVETRGGYYDTSGALKDMVQNHLLQILSIVAMERPERFDAAGMHEEQLRVFHALRPGDAVLGQYEGYRDEPLVDPASGTETFAALRLFVDTPRWRGTPFYIRTGKRLRRREMQVSVVFRPLAGAPSNVLLIRIQPTEGVCLQFNIKRPGDTDEMAEAKMDFCQSCSPQNRINTPEAYERLLGACLRGEGAWFSQWDQIEACWRLTDAIRDGCRGKLYSYAPGSDGPAEAGAL